MSVEIKSEYISVGGSNVLLVSVKGGSAVFGTCTAGHNHQRGDISTLKKLFYVGNEPLVVMNCPNNGDKRTDRIMSIAPGLAGMPHEISHVFMDCLNKINRGESLEMGLRDMFLLMPDGVYTVYSSEYYPTDGGGIFFWGAYNVAHEVRGSADCNRAIGANKTYRPCFLVPGKTLEFYTQKNRSVADEYVKSAKYHGIAYHLCGLHSVLLRGYHNAVACVEADIPYKCAVIEKIDDVYTEAAPKPAAKPAPQAEGAENAEAKPAAPEEREGITGFRSASIKIPLELMPKDMVRVLLENRSESKPSQYNTLINKLSQVRRRTVSNHALPAIVHQKSELLPDCEVIESAFAVSSLSEEQLQSLLNGDVECNGEVIINPNFYSSIVTACNYLQFHDEKRFIEFAVAIMENPELYATQEYIAKRVARLSNSKIYRYFKSVLESSEPKYEKILATAERYVREYELNH
ncbi:MAG: hypothetical protein ACI4KA_08285 [Oscillospiraceae bacterium]